MPKSKRIEENRARGAPWRQDMSIQFRGIHPLFGAEASGVELRTLEDPATLARIREGMDQYAVLVFRNQPLTNEEQIAFAQRFDGVLHTQTSVSVLGKNRFGNEALTDISNVNEKGELAAGNDRRRMSTLSNRLWHTDASFVDPAGRYSLLSARTVPPVNADTEFADMRAAYDALAADEKAALDGLHVFHSIVYSRHVIGFDFSPEEAARLPGAVHPLVRTIPRSLRKALYLASHASHIVEWPIPEGRMRLLDLTEHATQPAFVYRHEWRENDLVIWDNRATMHRARPFDDTRYRRELRRTTTLDIA
jgi:alpha-ketoglutarate-dependent 2,4-dichlorophenoxyacetate dioxygenase